MKFIKIALKEICQVAKIAWFNFSDFFWFQTNIHIICLGDSHIGVFREISQKKLIPQLNFDVISVSGATAQGIVNPNSQTNALEIFERRLKLAKPWQPIFIQLGEVDCGFVIWHRAKKYGVSIEEQLEFSIKNYCAFLAKVKAMGFGHIYVLSAPLPTIADDTKWGEVANARREIAASQQKRTDLTWKYNLILEEKCLELGINFLDVTTQQLNKNTGVIADIFLNTEPLDHHLNPKAYAELIVTKIMQAPYFSKIVKSHG